MGLAYIGITLVVVVSTYMAARLESQSASDRAVRVAGTLAALLDVSLDNELDKLKQGLFLAELLSAQRKDGSGGAFTAGHSEMISALHSDSPDLVTIRLLDSQGRVEFQTAPGQPLPPSIDNLNVLAQMQTHDEPIVFFGPYRDDVAKEAYIVLARKRANTEGKPPGIAYAVASISRFNNSVAALALSDKDASLVRRSDDFTIVQRTPFRTDAIGSKTYPAEFAQAVAQRPEQGFFTSIAPLDNELRYVGYKRMEHYPLYVSIGLSVRSPVHGGGPDTSGIYAWGLAAWLLLTGLMTQIALSKQSEESALEETKDSLKVAQALTLRLESSLAAAQKYAAELDALQAEKQAILDTASVGLAHVIDGRWAWINIEGARLLGYPKQELEGRPTSERLADEAMQQEIVETARAARAAGLNHCTIEIRVRAKDGQERLLEVRSRALDAGWRDAIVAARDITQERDTAKAMLALQLQQQTILETATVGLIEVRNEKVIWTNSEFGRMLGTTAQALEGQPLRNLYYDADAYARGVSMVRAQIQDGADVLSGDIELRHQDGRKRLIELRGRTVDANKFDAIYALTDVTEVRAQAEVLAQALKDAQAGNRAKSQFLSVISHEIRTPLNGVLGLIQLASLTEGLPDRARENIKDAFEAGQLLLVMLNDVMDYSGLSDGRPLIKPEPMRLFALAGYVYRMKRALPSNEHVALVVKYTPAQNLMVVADEMRLRQILLNLLNNAMKFTHVGTVRLEITAIPKADQTVEVVLSVLDTGIGMSEETQNHLFKPFMQADMSMSREYGGTGLGLAIVKGLVDQMGGEITVVSQLGMGSEFSVHLPFAVVQAEAPAPQTLEGSANQTPSSTLKMSDLMPEAARLTALQRAAKSSLEVQARESRRARNQQPEASEAPEFQASPSDTLEGGTAHGQTLMPLKRALQGLKILLVDDNRSNLDVETLMLEHCGAVVTQALSGHEAVVLAAAAPERFDVVLMDLQMSDLNGFETSMALRACPSERLQRIPIFAFTAGALTKDLPALIREAGMNDFIAKPVRLDTLVAMIRRWIPAHENIPTKP